MRNGVLEALSILSLVGAYFPVRMFVIRVGTRPLPGYTVIPDDFWSNTRTPEHPNPSAGKPILVGYPTRIPKVRRLFSGYLLAGYRPDIRKKEAERNVLFQLILYMREVEIPGDRAEKR